MVSCTLSRKLNPHKSTIQKIANATLFTFLLLFLTSCTSQQPAVVTVKKRPDSTVTKSKPAVVKTTPAAAKVTKAEEKKAAAAAKKAKAALDGAPLDEEEDVAISTTALLAIAAAEEYLGVRYRYSGNSRSGIDCSGLMNVAYAEAGLNIPRTSGGIMSKSEPVLLDHVQPGDFLFFATGRSRARVSHVGMVTQIINGTVEFIHSSSSQGVTKSLLSESYWNNAYLRAGRIEE